MLADGNIARARVLEQICHYAKKPWVSIGKNKFTAPPTNRLEWELGLSRRTIYKAISDLKAAGVVDVRYRTIKGHRRRCIRLLSDPCDQDIGPDPSQQDRADYEMQDVHLDSSVQVHGVQGPDEQPAPHGCAGVHIPDKMNIDVTETHGPGPDHAPETGQSPETGDCLPPAHIPGEASPLPSTPQSPPPPWKPRKTELSIGLHANGIARKLADRRGWNSMQERQFRDRFKARQMKYQE